MSDADANEWLMGSGAPSVGFPDIGAKVVGRVLKFELSQKRDFGTREPLIWPDGNPIMQGIFTLQLEDFTPEDEDDDGRRRLFVDKKNMRDAIGEAVRKAGHKGSLVGGRLGVVYTKDGEKKSGLNPPKMFGAKYEPPSIESVQTPDDAPVGPDTSDYDEPPF